MTDLSMFPITARWAPRHPDRLQLYSLPTPNGVKVSIALEEIGLPYDVHRIDFAAGDQRSPAFLSLNPNNKIPAILDPDGPGGAPLALFESGAILLYLAEKTGQLLPPDPTGRYQGCSRDTCKNRSPISFSRLNSNACAVFAPPQQFGTLLQILRRRPTAPAV